MTCIKEIKMKATYRKRYIMQKKKQSFIKIVRKNTWKKYRGTFITFL